MFAKAATFVRVGLANVLWDRPIVLEHATTPRPTTAIAASATQPVPPVKLAPTEAAKRQAVPSVKSSVTVFAPTHLQATATVGLVAMPVEAVKLVVLEVAGPRQPTPSIVGDAAKLVREARLVKAARVLVRQGRLSATTYAPTSSSTPTTAVDAANSANPAKFVSAEAVLSFANRERRTVRGHAMTPKRATFTAVDVETTAAPTLLAPAGCAATQALRTAATLV